MFPFGADDEDIEFNYIVERNLEVIFKIWLFQNSQFQIALLIVDDLHNQVPPVYCESLSDGIKVLLVLDFSSNFLIFIVFFFEILIFSFATRKLHPSSPTTHNGSIYESTH